MFRIKLLFITITLLVRIALRTLAPNRANTVAPYSVQHCFTERIWLVGCFGFNGPLKQYFSLYRAISQREGEIGEKR